MPNIIHCSVNNERWSEGGILTGQLTAGGTQDPTIPQVRNIYAGTANMVAGTTPLETGTIYFMYE
ncbi:hypothetical protein [Anaerotruncus rubiinfantis]|uniref:hypothetical protein n=1 Tax=Anaerotruncus rubiinfantis TaxID=1720200 RepID=UPI003D7A69F8